ncbi:similar to Saccharomyces cerevisiae YLR291C GCD7 Beta subunit of the translation initiation factor eIF2B, the guanine-nucleotide exchange factor for eIF2 [Maudiozyma barnettii]|uniref:Translation initiation factor eIF2B subunit beta n=1 Tax=Maudiozyma barnettii TaxID=61262 RepID=A0A8H2VHN2_9SACH|nr:translation initiation factor eIF2B subunit beta [Kazachstania barnettii]CAB4255851.1 similar to Saccharomyces cerevisiae YLR291C GCD7 Beta subunit of the translation initiation factor eIF2B, the guanine-nucleotide exchange factor for eIF2 [Kazachstania barnettii]CAD1784411.1 similar to Saccharomyces cerevisiae YLR291C GCD7 Beta subunit of the translation initiation factor eIF2B, the guanine-nucleotide exchange factor for eIF2 [Kazachstania barnettii]
MSSQSMPSLVHNNNPNAVTEIEVSIDSFIAKLKRRQISGSYIIALETLQLLKRFISAVRWSHVNELIAQIRELGNRLEKANPTAFGCGNVIKRILAVLRDEIEEDMKESQNAGASSSPSANNLNDRNSSAVGDVSQAEPLIASMFNLLQKPEQNSQDFYESKSKTKTDFRQVVIQAIKDLIDEIKNIDDGIQQIAIDLIHDHEILLTPTPESKTVLKFLIRARERANRTFTVLVTEGFPNNTQNAHDFAKKLAQHDIETIIIPDSAVFALMSRVGKVIIGTKTVFINGGSIVSSAGVSSVCECAREFKTPVFAVAGLYKLSPLYPFNVEKFVEFGGSQHILPRMDPRNRLDTINKITDYVPPENIDIYITNIGGFAPSFIYRIAWDNYKQIDVHLDGKQK